MGNAIGIRLPEKLLKKIEKLGEAEMEDRSTIIRKLVMIGYGSLILQRAAEKYRQGSITLSRAAHMAGVTLWEMERYLVETGFRSGYSSEDLKREIEHLEKKN